MGKNIKTGINKRGYKSGALHDGFKKSTGELILTMDVDARIYTDSIKKGYAQIMAENAVLWAKILKLE